jgi:hypothetical protein
MATRKEQIKALTDTGMSVEKAEALLGPPKFKNELAYGFTGERCGFTAERGDLATSTTGSKSRRRSSTGSATT